MNAIKRSLFYTWALTLLAFCSTGGCTPKSIGSMQGKQAAETKPHKSARIIASDSGHKFVNEDGWEILGLASSQKIGTYYPTVEAGNGTSVKMTLTEYKPESQVITEEPFKSLSEIPTSSITSLGSINIYDIREYGINAHIFCYRVRANRVSIDSGSGLISQVGGLFYFSYYDEDGNGKFESLELDEGSASDPPHIPVWIQRKG